jgi:hypothetical protein
MLIHQVSANGERDALARIVLDREIAVQRDWSAILSQDYVMTHHHAMKAKCSVLQPGNASLILTIA